MPGWIGVLSASMWTTKSYSGVRLQCSLAAEGLDHMVGDLSGGLVVAYQTLVGLVCGRRTRGKLDEIAGPVAFGRWRAWQTIQLQC